MTVSYFEWVQNRAADRWTVNVVNDRLAEVMKRAFAQVLGESTDRKVTMRTAAYCLGIERVAAAHRLRGICA